MYEFLRGRIDSNKDRVGVWSERFMNGSFVVDKGGGDEFDGSLRLKSMKVKSGKEWKIRLKFIINDFRLGNILNKI